MHSPLYPLPTPEVIELLDLPAELVGSFAMSQTAVRPHRDARQAAPVRKRIEVQVLDNPPKSIIGLFG